MRTQLLLLLVLVFLPTWRAVAMVESFSTQKQGARAILVTPDGTEIGSVEAEVKENVKKIKYEQKIYFMKDAEINNDEKLLEFRDKISGLVASYILNALFKGEEQRYPLLNLVFDSKFRMEKSKNDKRGIEPFYILSEQLQNFVSIAGFVEDNTYLKNEIDIRDRENLYTGMYLVGSGDPHMRNLFYNSGNHRLGNVDLDVAFKEHVPHKIQLQHKRVISPEFFEQYSDLAVRNINCNDIFANFLSATDSLFKEKSGWDRYYDRMIPLYQATGKMSKVRMIRAIKRLQSAFQDQKDLRRVINTTIDTLQEELRPIINSLLAPGETIFNDQGYFDKSSPVYEKYREARLIRALDFLFDEEQTYRSQVNQFVEQRYLTLICVFGGSETVTQEQCEECLKTSRPSPTPATAASPQTDDEL